MNTNSSRYRAVSRRRFLQTSAAGGLAAMIPGLACSNSNGSTLAEPISPAAPVSQGASSGEMIVSFSYVANDSGRVHSPYIAVWVEDAGGALIRTISLWFKSDERKYLSDLRRWNDADGRGNDAVLSGATRVPGEYAVSWDATTADGAPVAFGDYHLCIEAAREDGPYELIRQPITLDGAAFTMALPDDGELTSATVDFRV